MTQGEIISVAQMRAIDAAAAMAGTPTRVLMENAGEAVAAAVGDRFGAGQAAVLCGPGNNGGDGWVAARRLRDRGWAVAVYALSPRESLRGDAADAAHGWNGPVFELSGEAPVQADLYIDALFGAGLSKPLAGAAARHAEALSRNPERVVAVDVPSGLDGDAGKPRGDICFRAALTVTFVRKKPAHVLEPGRGYCGEVLVADIGAPESVVAAQNITVFENNPALWRFPWADVTAHKHLRGHVVVASGPRARTGAARLAARAALRVGAGLTTVLSPLDALGENAAQLTAVMVREAASLADYAEAAVTSACMVVGPALGLDDVAQARLDASLGAAGRCPLVLDADAISLLAPLRAELSPRDVLTPHIGEFRRAFPGLVERAPTRIEAARAAARQAGCTVLLKGPDTVIAAPDGRAIVNGTGTPFLATAGSGDVLAGLIAGLIAQGMSSFEAASAAAWLHGAAGESMGPGLIAEDLPEALPRVLNELAPPNLKMRALRN